MDAFEPVQTDAAHIPPRPDSHFSLLHFEGVKTSRKIFGKKFWAICLLEAEGIWGDLVIRQHWLHPFVSQSDSTENFQDFFLNNRLFSDEFLKFYRMSIKSFEELLEIFPPYLSKENE